MTTETIDLIAVTTALAIIVLIPWWAKPYPEYRARWFWYWVLTTRIHPDHLKHEMRKYDDRP